MFDPTPIIGPLATGTVEWVIEEKRSKDIHDAKVQDLQNQILLLVVQEGFSLFKTWLQSRITQKSSMTVEAIPPQVTLEK